MRKRLVVLISGSGTNLQAILDACDHPEFPAEVVAVGTDRADATGLQRAQQRGIPTFICQPQDFNIRSMWDRELTKLIDEYQPDWIVSAGFMRILGDFVLERFPNQIINTHPALLPSFQGAHAVRDALDYGVKITGCTVHLVDGGVDTGPVLAQVAVEVRDGDTEESLHERIKSVEHSLLVSVIEKICQSTIQISGREVTFA